MDNEYGFRFGGRIRHRSGTTMPMSIRLPIPLIKALHGIAASEGIPTTTWVREHLQRHVINQARQQP